VQTNGPAASPVNAIAINGSYIFAGTGTWSNLSGVYLSTNNGLTWTQTSLNNRRVLSLAVNSSIVLAGTGAGVYGDSGIFRSTNNGQTWANTIWGETVNALCITGINIFAGVWGHGLYISSDNGLTWYHNGSCSFTYSFAFSGINIYAGTIINWMGVFLSTNNGDTWIPIGLNNQWIYSLAVIGSSLYAGTSGNGVFLTTNNGQNWIQTSLNNQDVRSLAANGTNLFAGTNGNGIYLSLNNGLNWIQKNEGMGNQAICALAFTDSYIFAGANNGYVYRRPLSDFVPSAPLLYSPPNGSTGQPLSLNLIWYKNPIASSYRVQLSTDSIFNTNLIVNDSTLLTGDTIRAVSGLSYLTKYYWHVNAKNANGTSNYSTTWSFFTTPPDPAVVNLNVIPGGFYNTGTGQLRMRDTIKVMLVDSATCNKLDSAKVTIDPVTFSSSPTFVNISTGLYYIYVFHRNHLTICSRMRQTVTRGSTVSYDFTTDSTKAFGFNMIKVSASPVIWGMIPADANRDGYTDAIDQTIWIIQNGHTGYYSADFNGDGNVDGLDQSLWIIYNGRSTNLPCYVTPMR
jgi:hypothetical protein